MGKHRHVGVLRPPRTLGLLAALVAAVLVVAACTPATGGRVESASPGGSTASADPRRTPASPAPVIPTAPPSPDIRTPGAGSPLAAPSSEAARSSAPGPTVAAAPPFSAAKVALHLDRVAGGLVSPVFVTGAGTGDGRLYVVEQEGRIRVVEPDGRVTSAPFLDIVGRVRSGGEQGLLGLAFHPAYASNGRFYVDYTDRDGNTVVSEFRRASGSPLRADPASERMLLRIDQPYPNHNGGMVAFGKDGYLYVGMGDGGSAGDPEDRAQDLGALLGKILRIDVDHPVAGEAYGIPATNPFTKRAGARPEIWAFGVRNPWRFSFDRTTGDLWIGDVGQGAWEEIDRARASAGGGRGANYGWRLAEGRACFDPPAGCPTDGLTAPLAAYGHGDGCAVTGGYVYRGAASPILGGGYLFADFCSGRIWGLDAAGPDVQEPVALLDSGRSVASFGQGDDGELYLVDLASGELFRIVATER